MRSMMRSKAIRMDEPDNQLTLMKKLFKIFTELVGANSKLEFVKPVKCVW